MSNEGSTGTNMSDFINKFCEHIEERLENEDGLDSEDKKLLLEELKDIRALSEEAARFVSEYPQLCRVLSFGARILSDHESKLELLKDALVSNGLIIQVEAETAEEAVEMAKKTLHDEMIADMLAKVDKSTIH